MSRPKGVRGSTPPRMYVGNQGRKGQVTRLNGAATAAITGGAARNVKVAVVWQPSTRRVILQPIPDQPDDNGMVQLGAVTLAYDESRMWAQRIRTLLEEAGVEGLPAGEWVDGRWNAMEGRLEFDLPRTKRVAKTTTNQKGESK